MSITRTRARHAAVALLLLAAVTALTACSGSDSDEPDPTTTPPSITAAPPETAPVTTASPTTPTPTSAPPSTGNAEIDALLATSRDAEYHVIYDDGNGSTFEIYRADGQIVLFASGQAIYQLADGTSAFCELADTPVCTTLPVGGGGLDATLGQIFGSFGAVLAGSESGESPFGPTTSLADDTVAERPARCASAATPTGSYAVCLDAEIGILLSASGDDGTGARSIQARRVEVDTVDPSIFELPAQIVA